MNATRAPTDARRGLRLGRRAFLAGTAAFLAACGGAGPRATPRRALLDRLVLSWWSDSGYPSPFAFSAIGPGGIVKLMLLFDTLTWKDATGVIPWLAERWSVEEGGASYVFRVRSGVTFHDGRPVTARDVAFTFSYFARFPFKWVSTAAVAGADEVDERTVRVRLRRPFTPFLEDVAGAVPILPEHVWSDVADPLKFFERAAVIGSGPYELASYADGKGEYVFRARPSHFAGVPQVRELVYVVVPPAQRGNVLQNRAVDVFPSPDYDVVPAFGNGRPYQVFTTPPFSITRLIFNVERAPFTDKRVRQAVAHAIDRRDLAERATRAPDVVAASASVVPPGSPWLASGLKEYAYDRQRAGRLLDEAGLKDVDGDGSRETPDGGKLTLDLLADPTTMDARIVALHLRSVGLGSRFVGGDPKTRAELQEKRQFSLALASHMGVGGDPDYLRRWYAGETVGPSEAGNVLRSAEFDALAEEQARELDVRKRRSLVARLQLVLAEELPTLPLYHQRLYVVYDATKWDRWFNTAGGILNGIPLLENKLSFLQ